VKLNFDNRSNLFEDVIRQSASLL